MSAFTPGRSGSADGCDTRPFAGRGASLRAAGSGASAVGLPRRAPALLLGLFAAVLFVLAAALPSSAFAAEYTQGPTLCSATGSDAGQCQVTRSVAVDQSTGMIYALDTGNRRVNQFEPDGTFVRAWGFSVRTNATEFQICDTGTGCRMGLANPIASQQAQGAIVNLARGIAVDPDTHIVYVTNSNTNLSLYNGSTGDYIGSTTGTTGTAEPSPPTPVAITLGMGLAVDTSDSGQHYLWLNSNTDSNTKTVLNKFEVAGPGGLPALAFDCQITGTEAPSSDDECPDGPSKDGAFDGIRTGAAGEAGANQAGGNLATDGEGNVFVAEGLAGSVDRQVISQFGKNGLFLNQFKPVGFDGNPKPEGIAASSDGNVFAAVGGVGTNAGGNVIHEYDPDDPSAPVSEFGSGVIGGSYGVAINNTGAGGVAPGTVYVADQANQRIWTFASGEPDEHTLTVTVDGDGDGTVISDPEGIVCDKSTSPCSEDFLEGPITLEADHDDPGSVFSGWSGTGVGSCGADPECVVTLDDDKSITATFAPAPFDLEVSVIGEGEVDAVEPPNPTAGAIAACREAGDDCLATYTNGDVVTLEATADGGHDFSGWSGAGCSGVDTCVVTMDAAKSVTATFSPAGSHSLTITKAGNGNGTFQCNVNDTGFDTCPTTVPDGSDVKIQATPEAASSTFDGWSNGGGSAETCSGTGLCEFEITANSSVTGTFTLEQRTLTITKAGTGDGSFQCNTGSGFGSCATSYAHGTSVTIQATPAASSSFTPGWSDGDGSASSCSGTGTCAFTITADSSVTGTFTLQQRTLTVTKVGNGTGALQCDSGSGFGACAASYPDGTSVTIQASPDLDTSVFTGWSGGSGSATVCNGTTDPCTFTITANSSVTGTIALAKRQLTVSKAGSGTGTVTSSPSGIDCGSGIACEAGFDHGTTVLLSGAPGANSHDVVWTSGCDGVNGSNQCMVEMDAAKDVTATFSLTSHQLNASTAGTGTGAITSSPAGIVCGTVCSAPFEFGTTVTLTATPAAGSVFAGWTGACTGMGPCHVTITQARMVSAHFDALPIVGPFPDPEIVIGLGPDLILKQKINRQFRDCRTNAQRAFRQANRRANKRLKGKAKARVKRAAAKQRNRAIKRCQTQRRNRLQRL